MTISFTPYHMRLKLLRWKFQYYVAHPSLSTGHDTSLQSATEISLLENPIALCPNKNQTQDLIVSSHVASTRPTSFYNIFTTIFHQFTLPFENIPFTRIIPTEYRKTLLEYSNAISMREKLSPVLCNMIWTPIQTTNAWDTFENSIKEYSYIRVANLRVFPRYVLFLWWYGFGLGQDSYRLLGSQSVLIRLGSF